ncbi:MAG TPA: class I SAM-dependent methyltransferase [Ilumatobacteraceae bacterium]|nr:class I SAM-dependent methyltransferase [Ilumatobacteraceae bacterium]
MREMRDTDERTANRRVRRRGSSAEQHLAERHFAHVASRYTSLRQTDDDAVFQIRDRLPGGPLVGVDVGAGTGRYTALLAKILGDRASVHAVDLSQDMLLVLLQDQRQGERSVACCEAERLPIADSSVDFVTTFNAVHHFDLDRFVQEAARVLAPNGHLFIYTRTPHQNADSIWGRAFPGFTSRETRLHDEATLCQKVQRLGTVNVKSFSFSRRATPTKLAERVRGRAYSTFALYEPDELEDALERFLKAMDDRDEVHWHDHNVLIHVRRA